MSAARALLPAKMRFTALFFVLLVSAEVNGYYDYDYLNCAKREIPDLVGEPTNGDHGFKITISGDNSDRMMSKSKNVPGGMYTIVLQSDKRSSKKFTEFMLYVEPKEMYTMSQSTSPDDGFLTSQTFNDLGKFQLYTDSLVKLADYCPNAVTQTTPVPKSEISVMWLAPSASFGCVVFKAVVIEHKDAWFHADGGLSKLFCEEELDFKDKEENITECCACDEAKYEVTFEGLWSKYTHPKDFPLNEWQAHFSDIIGASHSSNFRIWNYGGYATEGVKQVAQSGITKKLEAELKTESNKIRTIIKARGFGHTNLNGKTFAVFRVDKKHHLMSLLSRLAPSPDWVVGVSALELCLKNCTWVTEKSMDLYLWDAGTDSGITYLSPDSPTIPQERIRHITNKSPSLPESPFYDPTGGPMKPFVRLTVARQRIYEKTDCNSTEDETLSFDENDRYCRVTEWTVFGPCSVSCGEGMRKRTRNYLDEKAAKEAKCRVTLVEKEECGAKCINNVSCETTSWSDWQPCNVTCGRGYRTRSRKFMHRLARKMCTNVELVQKEPCMGMMPVCDGTSLPPRSSCYGSPYCNTEVEIIDPNCTVTKWSEWSPCSKSCGKGIKIRTRLYINPYKSKHVCNVRLVQSIECETEQCPTNRNDARTVCMLPREVGPCRGYFPRYYFDSSKGVCVQFIFSGCRGNHNNFERLLDCKDKCENFAKVTLDAFKAVPQYSNYSLTPPINDQGPVINCSVTEWSEWSPCSRTCGNARKERRREIKLNAQNGGKPCPRRLVQRRKCKDNPPCDCELSEWSDWSECEASCNGNGLASRKRNITRRPDPGRPPCGITVERKYCINYARCDGT